MAVSDEVKALEDRIKELEAEREEILKDYWDMRGPLKEIIIAFRNHATFTTHTVESPVKFTGNCFLCGTQWYPVTDFQHHTRCKLGMAEKLLKEMSNGS